MQHVGKVSGGENGQMFVYGGFFRLTHLSHQVLTSSYVTGVIGRKLFSDLFHVLQYLHVFHVVRTHGPGFTVGQARAVACSALMKRAPNRLQYNEEDCHYYSGAFEKNLKKLLLV
jgi:hypothetical protein